MGGGSSAYDYLDSTNPTLALLCRAGNYSCAVELTYTCPGGEFNYTQPSALSGSPASQLSIF